MNEEKLELILLIFKADIGITSKVKDEYFKTLIQATAEELRQKFNLDLQVTEDQILLSDYSAWRYRKRGEDMEASKNLQYRIRNRIVRDRGK